MYVCNLWYNCCNNYSENTYIDTYIILEKQNIMYNICGSSVGNFVVKQPPVGNFAMVHPPPQKKITQVRPWVGIIRNGTERD